VSLRSRHGKSARHGVGPVIESTPLAELPDPVQAIEVAEARAERTALGTWQKGSRTAQSKGGQARRRWGTLARECTELAKRVHPEIQPDMKDAKKFFVATCGYLGAHVAGGAPLGPLEQSYVQRAAVYRAVERALLRLGLGSLFFMKTLAKVDRENGEKPEVNTKLLALAEKMGKASKDNLLAAWEICARQGGARKKLGVGAPDHHAALLHALSDDADGGREE
jgi:hypothetical protein